MDGLYCIGGIIVFVILILTLNLYVQSRRDDRRLLKWETFAEKRGLDSKLKFPPLLVKGIYRNFAIELILNNNEKNGFLELVLTISKEDLADRVAAISLLDEPEKLELAWEKLDVAIGQLNLLRSDIKFDAAHRKIHFYYPEQLISLDEMYEMSEPVANLFEAYLDIFVFGGVAVPDLVSILSKQGEKPLVSNQFTRHLANSLLIDLRRDTIRRFGYAIYTHFCIRCLTYVGPRQVNVPRRKPIKYYGCRQCGQSRAIFSGKVATVLDNTLPDELSEGDDRINVNWLINRVLFDFSEVEIVQATDEEVERFAVQVGNDTDEYRRDWRKSMVCTVHSTCNLSENTMRILERTFGEVRVI